MSQRETKDTRIWLLQALLNYNWGLDANFPNFDFTILISFLETQTNILGNTSAAPSASYCMGEV